MKKQLFIPILLSALTAFPAANALTPSVGKQPATLISTDASQPTEITFLDLKGPIEPFYNPFKELTERQLYNLSLYARISEIQESLPDSVSDEMLEEMATAKKQLEKDGIDIEYLLELEKIIIAKYKAASFSTNDEFTNKEIKIAGYMLPLEFKNDKVSEFLLVPTVGACSHQPVPAANQILYIQSKQPFEVKTLYMPINVSGKLLVEKREKELFLIDGSKDINMAYSIKDADVESYKN